MAFRIVEIDLENRERIVSIVSFATREEAAKHASQCVATFKGGHGYDEKQGVWWGKDLEGHTSHIFVDG